MQVRNHFMYLVLGSFLLILTGIQSIFAQSYNPNKKYSIQALQEDFSLLRTALEKTHPGTYWYTPKDSMDHYFDETYGQISEPMTEREFYRLILPVIVQVKCGHTYPEMSDEYYNSDRPDNEYLPFELFLDGDRLFIVKNGSTDSTLQQGDEIIRLGKYSVSEIAKRARSLQSADGNNESWKNKFISMYYFEDVYTEYYGGKSPFDITVLDKNGVIKETNVSSPQIMTEPVTRFIALTRKERYKQEKQKAEEERASQIRFRLTKPDSSAAILKINGFSYDKVYGANYLKKHAAIFEMIAERNIENLVIDLRGNTGGNMNISEDLMRYIIDKPFKAVAKNEIQTNDLTYYKTLEKYLEKQPSQRRFPYKKLKRTGENTYNFKFFKERLTKPVKKNRFDGNVYIITDGWVFSAGSMFVSSLRSQRKVTIVGEETGGAAVGCSGGRISRLVLPNTHLRVFFPHFRMYAVTESVADGHGVIPDYIIKPSLSDVANKRDVEMKKVFELIKNNH